MPISVFLDLSKAFDTLDHSILLQKLDYYGLQGTAINWFGSYLEGRSQYTEINGCHSEVIKLETGVHQGSVLGPLLFIIYMNDIHIATANFKAILYADDTNLISPVCSFNSGQTLTTLNVKEFAQNINAELAKNGLS